MLFNCENACVDRLLATVEGKVHLVLDGHSVYRSKRVREWVTQRAGRIELHFLPPCAPHCETVCSSDIRLRS